MIFGEGPIIKNIAGDLNKLFLQGTRVGQPINNVEGDAAADQATVQLMSDRDPVIRDISTGLGYEGQYKALEYITIPQGAYINTGFTSDSLTLELKTKLQMNDYAQYGSAYGNYIDEYTNVIRMIWATSSDSFYFNLNHRAGTPISANVGTSMASGVMSIVQTRTTVIINGTSFTAGGSVGTNNNTSIVLGASKLNPTGGMPGLKKLYYFDISDNGVTLLRLRPAKRVSDDAIGLYDAVSNTFLESVTSTPITAGPELDYYYPIP